MHKKMIFPTVFLPVIVPWRTGKMQSGWASVLFFSLVQRIKPRICCLQSVYHEGILKGQPWERISRQGEPQRVPCSDFGPVRWWLEGLVNSVVLGGWLQEGQDSPGITARCQASMCPSQGQLHLIWEKNKVSFAACCLCNTDTGFFNNKNII